MKPIGQIEVVIVLLVLFAAFFLGFRPGRGRWRRRKRRFHKATAKQISYLQALVEKQNFFRSHPVSYEKWIGEKTPSGYLSLKFASELIQSLVAENEALQSEFDELRNRPQVGTYRGEIYASDLRSFFFCERSAYFSTHGFPAQNLIDMAKGDRLHRASSDTVRRDSRRPATLTWIIQGLEKDVTRVEWLPNTKEFNLRHRTLPVSGRPDGFLHFRDGTKAVIELKSVSRLPADLWKNDLRQAEVYLLMAPKDMRLRDEVFVLYVERATREVALHKRPRVFSEHDLAQTVAKIERGARTKSELEVTGSEAQCRSCGYRSVCSR